MGVQPAPVADPPDLAQGIGFAAAIAVLVVGVQGVTRFAGREPQHLLPRHPVQFVVATLGHRALGVPAADRRAQGVAGAGR